MPKYKGALCVISWKDVKNAIDQDHNYETCYFSFGEYNEDSDQDGFGVYDEDIFFYTTLEELKADKFSDFNIISIECLSYNIKEEENANI